MINMGEFSLDNTFRVERIKVLTDTGMDTQEAVIAHDAAVEAVTVAFKAAQASLDTVKEGIIRDAATSLTFKMLEANASVIQEAHLVDVMFSMLIKAAGRRK